MPAFRFCPNCSNSLYPLEDRHSRVLLFVCRHCGKRERAENTCVHTTSFASGQEDKAVDTENIVNDPTFARADVTCPVCHYGSAVFFQSRSKRRDASMKLFFVCANPMCKHRWGGTDHNNDVE